MREYTQTVTASAANGWAGNCWQTCVASLLDVDPATLPDQASCDLYETTAEGQRGPGVKGTPSYWSWLNAYLRKHHGLVYVELHIHEETLPLLRVAEPGWHMMTGRTVRSDTMGGLRHVVVALHGEMVWDPHPSRAGLLEEQRWAFLAPYPKAWADHPMTACFCPSCGGKP